MKKIFGFDLDGVLYNWHRVAYDYMVYTHGESRSYFQFWQDIIDGKDDRGDFFWDNIVRIPILYEQLPAKNEDVRTLWELSKHFEIVYLTHRPKEVEFVTGNWLRRYNFPNIDRIYLITTSKSIAVRQFHCDYYIEDRKDILNSNLREVVNLIAKRTLWNWEECESLPFVDTIPELLTIV